MDKKSLMVLKADIEAQVREIETIYAKLEERKHAYAYELDARKIHIVVEDAGKLKVLYRKDVEAFLDNFLC